MKIRNCNWAALWLLIVITALLTTGISRVRAVSIVSPSGLEDSEGDTGSSTPTTPFRVQWLYPASDFGLMPAGGGFIVGHSIRANRNQQIEATNTFADSVFTLSTTSLNSLEETFANNLGSDATVVFDGSTSISYPVSGPTEGPRPFGENVEYQTPFFYDPSLGNLLVEQISTSGNDVPDTRKDWQTTTTDTVVSGSLRSSTGSLSKTVVVTQFTIVPEPNFTVLFMTGFVCLLSCGGRRMN